MRPSMPITFNPVTTPFALFIYNLNEKYNKKHPDSVGTRIYLNSLIGVLEQHLERFSCSYDHFIWGQVSRLENSVLDYVNALEETGAKARLCKLLIWAAFEFPKDRSGCSNFPRFCQELYKSVQFVQSQQQEKGQIYPFPTVKELTTWIIAHKEDLFGLFNNDREIAYQFLNRFFKDFALPSGQLQSQQDWFETRCRATQDEMQSGLIVEMKENGWTCADINWVFPSSSALNMEGESEINIEQVEVKPVLASVRSGLSDLFRPAEIAAITTFFENLIALGCCRDEFEGRFGFCYRQLFSEKLNQNFSGLVNTILKNQDGDGAHRLIEVARASLYDTPDIKGSFEFFITQSGLKELAETHHDALNSQETLDPEVKKDSFERHDTELYDGRPRTF